MRGFRRGMAQGMGRGFGRGFGRGLGFGEDRNFGGRFDPKNEEGFSRGLKDGKGIGSGRGGRNANMSPCQGNGQGFATGGGRGHGYNRA